MSQDLYQYLDQLDAVTKVRYEPSKGGGGICSHVPLR